MRVSEQYLTELTMVGPFGYATQIWHKPKRVLIVYEDVPEAPVILKTDDREERDG